MIRSLSRTSEREQILAAAIVLLFVGYILYLGICAPQMLRLDATIAKLDAQKHLLDLKRMAATRLTVSEKRCDDLQQEIDKQESSFFSTG